MYLLGESWDGEQAEGTQPATCPEVEKNLAQISCL